MLEHPNEINPEKTSWNVEIVYCTQCRWLLRAAWLAQELLTTFEQDLNSVALKPGTGGIFHVTLNGELLFSRKEAGRFPGSQGDQAIDSGPDRPGARPRP